MIRAIRRLGLKVSPAKSEAVWFYNWWNRAAPPPGLCLNLNGEDVEVGLQMKYLDLAIDSRWTFGPHFRSLDPKVMTAANALYSLLPNIGEAGVEVRRLYKRVVFSWVLYAALVWAGNLMPGRRRLLLLRRLHRTTAIRIVRGYRIVSYTSATVLAASPPFEL